MTFGILGNITLFRFILYITVTIVAAVFGILLAVSYVLLTRGQLLFACLKRMADLHYETK